MQEVYLRILFGVYFMGLEGVGKLVNTYISSVIKNVVNQFKVQYMFVLVVDLCMLLVD